MPQFRLHGVEVYYRDEGAGPPVILGHSSTGSSGQWRSMIGRLSERYRLLAPDQLGYGRTGAYPGAPSLADFETEIFETLLDLAGTPAHLVGHSYGGMIMASTAVRNPDRVRSLSLIEPALFHLLLPAGRKDAHAEIKAVADRVNRYIDADAPEEAARAFIDYWATGGAYDAMEPRVRTAVLASMPKVRVEWPETFKPWSATATALGQLRMPIHLVRAKQTTAAARAVTDVLREIWPASEFREIEGAGHMSPLTHADQVCAILEEFLDRQIEGSPEGCQLSGFDLPSFGGDALANL